MADVRLGLRILSATLGLLSCAQVREQRPPAPDKPGTPRTTTPPAASHAAPTALDLEIPELEPLLQSAITARRLPGAVIAVGNGRGISFLHAYGARALEPAREVMTQDTIFDLASLTKPIVTATLTMQLVDSGRLALDVPLSRYVPQRSAATRCTIRQLLLHSCGLGHVDRLHDYRDPQGTLTRILSQPLSAAPGERFSYSDLGYIVLGKLIERVTGQGLDSLATQRLFEPLGMRDSGYRPDPQLWPRIAPTQRLSGERAKLVSSEARANAVIRGEVHDPRAFRMGGVAGHAGAFASATDLARYARMLLNHGSLDGARILSQRAVEQITAPQPIGPDIRTLGWDMHTRYSGLRGTLLSERAFGHGGFTGTSLWIDPTRDLFVIFLSNRVHPDGHGYVIPLVGQVTDTVVRHVDAQHQAAPPATARAAEPPPASAAACGAPRARVLTGIDVLRAHGFAELRGRNVGLVINRASRARDGTPTWELMRAAPGVHVRAVFAPEHGLSSSTEGKVADAALDGLPVYSLFGKTRRPTTQMLRGIDSVVFDLPDVGVRFYTYASTLRQILEAADHTSIEVVVLDRPNPIGADQIEGPVLDPTLESFVNFHPLPVRHGLTIGELASLLRAERGYGTKLRVIAMQGYSRELRYAQTGLQWTAPSPNLPTPEVAVLYPALGLLESTNLSVGRGTDLPFTFVGAPWLDGVRLSRALNDASLPGVHFDPLDLTPRDDRYAGQLCHGVRVSVDDPAAFRAVHTGFAIAYQVHAQQPQRWEARKLTRLAGDAGVVAALQKGATVSELERLWQPALTRFAEIRARYLRYPTCKE